MSRRKAKWRAGREKADSDKWSGELVDFIRDVSPGTNIKFGNTSPGRRKLSECVVELVDDILDAFPDKYTQLVPLAIAVWNAGLSSEEEKEEMLQDILEDLHVREADISTIQDLFYKLLFRRKQGFPDDHRLIVDFEITPVGETFNLRVVSHDLAEEEG